ncbi:hypothetical protein [Anaerocolumna xylanovorans]|uniref:Uncharacterized protein n=1 Tax=Anaerocolumna xylanovorans DSM 12503 TaxID=1121345 RepID=A0A1M7Y6D0_9FIRM|nr:hypothetical protein [Anaerocolumna xylanovorans]SHO48207.1 hypothetical protein SAMN02745217_01720 [Anaerocolumna xylanovorans DSM 12503]
MKNKVVALMMAGIMLFTLNGITAFAKENESQTRSWVAPVTETTQNGIPESQIITPYDVIIGPYFSSYNYNVTSKVDKFKTIATFSHNNKYGSGPAVMNGVVTNSTSQGSEWSGNVSFTGEIKAGILADIKTQVGVGYKDSRSTNEAVGYSLSYTVPKGKVGHIDLYYRGTKVGGTVTTWTAYTANMNNKLYTTSYVYATVYPSSNIDIYSETYDTTN